MQCNGGCHCVTEANACQWAPESQGRVKGLQEEESQAAAPPEGQRAEPGGGRGRGGKTWSKESVCSILACRTAVHQLSVSIHLLHWGGGQYFSLSRFFCSFIFGQELSFFW